MTDTPEILEKMKAVAEWLGHLGLNHTFREFERFRRAEPVILFAALARHAITARGLHVMQYKRDWVPNHIAVYREKDQNPCVLMSKVQIYEIGDALSEAHAVIEAINEVRLMELADKLKKRRAELDAQGIKRSSKEELLG